MLIFVRQGICDAPVGRSRVLPIDFIMRSSPGPYTES